MNALQAGPLQKRFLVSCFLRPQQMSFWSSWFTRMLLKCARMGSRCLSEVPSLEKAPPGCWVCNCRTWWRQKEDFPLMLPWLTCRRFPSCQVRHIAKYPMLEFSVILWRYVVCCLARRKHQWLAITAILPTVPMAIHNMLRSLVKVTQYVMTCPVRDNIH